ncbi:MAG: Long-chain fatty acid transport protein [Fibrobacteres bacterium]|nr:Long-chain fatty acid transport protein [Fibrobacterota bacterium]
MLWAQGTTVPGLNLGRHQDVSARAMALGGSFTGVANDFSALYYNPAGLTSIRKHEGQFTLEGNNLGAKGWTGSFPSRQGNQENLAVQSFGLVLPVPTERGGLCFALGSYVPRTFSDVLTYNDALSPQRGPYDYRAEGDLRHYRFGMAVDLSPDVVFGFAASYINGDEKIDIQDVPATRYLRSYGGFNLEPALLFKVTPRLRMGASLVALERFTVNETFQQSGQNSVQQEFSVHDPLQIKLGLCYQGLRYMLAADYKAFNWSGYRIGLHDADFLDNPGFRTEHVASLGGEYMLRPWPVMLRAGYMYNTLVGPDLHPTYNIHRVSAGAGFIAGGTVDISAAYAYAFWEAGSSQAYSENREQRVLLTFGYRY